jgi:hypothetical protein
VTMAQTAAAARPPKLPFWRMVGRAYAAPFVNFGALVRAAWLWLLILAPVLLAISWLQAPMEIDVLARIGGGPDTVHDPWELRLLSLLQQLVMLPAMASIAVAWHRLILVHERPAGANLRLDGSVAIYGLFLLATVLLLTLLGDAPRMIASGLAPRLADVLGIALSLAAALVIGRLSLVLPAIALGRADIGLGDAWRATRGNTWRLFWGPIVCLLLLVLPGLVVFMLAQADRVTFAIAMAALELVSILGGIVEVGFLSFAFQHFFAGGRAD